MSLGRRLISTGGAAACTTDSHDIFSGGVALYTLDYDASDASGSYDGTPSNVTFGVGGQINYGARFNGSSSKIDLGNNSSNNSSTISVSLWFKTDGHSGTATIINNGGANSSEKGYNLRLKSSGYLSLATNELSSSFSIDGSVDYADNDWHHLVFTYNSGTYNIYIDGNTTPVITGTNATFTSTATRPTWIGQFSYTASNLEFFDGDIDQVRLFNRVLTTSEVSTLYAEIACVYTATANNADFPSGATAIAHYPLDNNSLDNKGSNDGTDTKIEYRFGRYGQAAVFNGSDSKIDTGAPMVSGLSAFSFSVWVNFDNLATHNFIIFNTESSGNGQHGFYGWTDGNLYFQPDSTTSANRASLSTSGLMTTNQWVHIVMVFDGSATGNSNRLKVYIQGEEESLTYGGTIPATTGTITNNLLIGARGSQSHSFHGEIDQVRIYSTALDSDQVTELYNEKPETDTSNFKTVVWNGKSAREYFSQIGFQPDLMWVKRRNSTANHYLIDSVVGDGKYRYSNTTNADITSSESDVFNANGVFLNSSNLANNSAGTYVAWCWKAGGDAVNIGVNSITGSTPSIASDVSANQDAGFSIVKYTGNSTDSATVGHGLSAAPELVIVKDLDGSNYWCVGGSIVGDGENLYLNVTTQKQTRDRVKSVQTNTFTLGSHFEVNSTNEFIAYCFHSVDGYSRISTYEGSGNSQTIYVTDDGTSSGSGGFEPSFVMVKNIDGAGNWMIYDAVRDADGTINKYLEPNTSDAEASASTASISPISNGFTIGNSNSLHLNDSTDTYIYMAFK